MANGLPGNLVEAYRAGIIAMNWFMFIKILYFGCKVSEYFLKRFAVSIIFSTFVRFLKDRQS
jgi:hypothetical protein